MSLTPHELVDVLIIGGSHAGLSAALTLYRAQHSTIIFDTQSPRNSYGTPVHLLSTWDNQDTAKLKAESRTELEQAGFTRFICTEITSVKKQLDGTFLVTDALGSMAWQGRKLLLANGSKDVFPVLDGYKALYAKRIFQCMFQFGFEQRGCESAGLLAIEGLANVFHACMLAEDGNKFAARMTIYTNGNDELAEQIVLSIESPTISVDNRELKKVSEATKTPTAVAIEFEDGSTTVECFIVHRPDTKLDHKLVSQLGLAISERGDIKVAEPFCQTNVAGVYAAGDCASPMKIIPNAISMGAYAGCGIARELPRGVTGNAIAIKPLTIGRT